MLSNIKKRHKTEVLRAKFSAIKALVKEHYMLSGDDFMRPGTSHIAKRVVIYSLHEYARIEDQSIDYSNDVIKKICGIDRNYLNASVLQIREVMATDREIAQLVKQICQKVLFPSNTEVLCQ